MQTKFEFEASVEQDIYANGNTHNHSLIMPLFKEQKKWILFREFKSYLCFCSIYCLLIIHSIQYCKQEVLVFQEYNNVISLQLKNSFSSVLLAKTRIEVLG